MEDMTSHLKTENISVVREILRTRQYLTQPFDNQVPHTGLSGIILNENLVHFKELVAKLQIEGMEDILLHKNKKIKPIFVTSGKQKRSLELENVTVKQLENAIFDAIENLPNPKQEIMQDQFKRSKARWNKPNFIDFLNEIKEILL